jgi:hypothetical protein
MFAIKAEVGDPRAETFAFSAQKTDITGRWVTIRLIDARSVEGHLRCGEVWDRPGL